MSRWIPIARVEECPAGESVERVAEDRVVALYQAGGGFFALDGVCPHQGGPLGKGKLTGCIVTCPWHGWQFDVRDGRRQLSAGIRQESFAVRVEKDTIWIELPE